MSAYMYYEYISLGSWKSIRKMYKPSDIYCKLTCYNMVSWLLSVLLLNIRWKSIILHIILKFMLLGGENVVTNCR